MPTPVLVIIAEVEEGTRNSSAANFRTAVKGAASGTWISRKGRRSSDAKVILKVNFALSSPYIQITMEQDDEGGVCGPCCSCLFIVGTQHLGLSALLIYWDVDCVLGWKQGIDAFAYMQQLWNLAMCVSMTALWFALLALVLSLICQRECIAVLLGKLILIIAGPNLLAWNVVGTVSNSLKFNDFCVKKADCDSDFFVIALRVCGWLMLYCLAGTCCYALFLLVKNYVRERRLQRRMKTWRKQVMQEFGEILMESDSDATCSICLDGYKKGEKATTLPDCNHQFHSECVQIWLERNATCPVCRRVAVEGLDTELSSLAEAN